MYMFFEGFYEFLVGRQQRDDRNYDDTNNQITITIHNIGFCGLLQFFHVASGCRNRSFGTLRESVSLHREGFRNRTVTQDLHFVVRRDEAGSYQRVIVTSVRFFLAASSSSVERLIGLNSTLFRLVKPNFGRRRCNGI